jgi:histidine triad (HIT) family protein
MTRVKGCSFCEIAANPKLRNTIYEDEGIMAILDIHPVNPGHTLMITKKHFTNLYDIPKPILVRVAELSKDVAKRLHERLKANGISIFQMSEKAGDQDIMHYHLHVVPRTTNDWFHKELAKAAGVQSKINPAKEELASVTKMLRLE